MKARRDQPTSSERTIARAAGVACGLLLLVAYASSAFGQAAPDVVTLYSPIKYKDDFSRASFDFQNGRFGTKAGWDLTYGAPYIGADQDWFKASTFGNDRHFIRDLGGLNWSDEIQVPVLSPRPESLGTKENPITVNASAGEYDKWVQQAAQEGIFVKAVVGHMYVLRAKNLQSDYYVLFRVESLQRGDSCTISWRRVPSPK